jgi:STAS domain-containing protein
LTALLVMSSLLARPAVRGDTARSSVLTPIAPHGVEIYDVSDPLLIDRAATLLHTLGAIGWRPDVLILDLTGLDRIDATALRVIRQMLDRESGSGMLVLVAGSGWSGTEALTRSRALPESVLFDSLDDAVQRAGSTRRARAVDLRA